MLSFALRHPVSFLFSVALHGVIAAALVMGLEFDTGQRVIPQQAIQARVVDSAAIERERERIAEAERAAIAERERQEREVREAAERERLAREQERERLAEAERAEQEREDQLRVQREREAAEAAEREAEAERERQRQAELERERREEERRQAEAEQQRREEEERRRLAAEAEARKQAELEAELARALAVEEERRQAEEAGLLDQYLRAIQNQIERNWIAPPTARPGLECVINVTQIPSGDVVGVSFGACNGDDAVKRSIEAAVLRSSPLPRPPVASLFNRSVVVTFKPEV